MRIVRLFVKSVLVLVAIVILGFGLLLLTFGWSSSNTKQANGECSMLIIEKQIPQSKPSTDYRRACMAAKGYGMDFNCYVNNFDSASCFIPNWMFWAKTM